MASAGWLRWIFVWGLLSMILTGVWLVHAEIITTSYPVSVAADDGIVRSVTGQEVSSGHLLMKDDRAYSEDNFSNIVQTYEEIYLSALPGPPDGGVGTFGYLFLGDEFYPGTTFEIDRYAAIGKIGGAFKASANSGVVTIFGLVAPTPSGAIVPDLDLILPNQRTLIEVPSSPPGSHDRWGHVYQVLAPGSYTMLFGTGRYGVTGDGVAVYADNIDLDPALPFTYLAATDSIIYQNAEVRFFVEGSFLADPGAGVKLIGPDDFGPFAELIDFETGSTGMPEIPGITFLSGGPRDGIWFGGSASGLDDFFGNQALINTVSLTYGNLGIVFEQPVFRVGAYMGVIDGYTHEWPEQVMLAAYDVTGNLIYQSEVGVPTVGERPLFVGLESDVGIARVEWLGHDSGFYGVDNIMYEAPVSVEVIHESATMGPVGQISGAEISSSQFLGSRFSISQTIQVTAIGGHLMQWGAGDIFGAIVELSSPSDLPNGSPFTGSEVVASTVFDPNVPSSDYLTPLSVTLAPGDYALIFGTNALGSSGGLGAMPGEGQSDLPGASYIGWFNSSWVNAQSFQGRFVVEGIVGPNEIDPNAPDPNDPMVISLNPADGTTITAVSVDVEVTFSESVFGVDAGDMVLSGSAAGGASVATPNNLGGNSWRFPVNGLVTGTLQVSLGSNLNDIVDTVGNGLSPSPTVWAYTVTIGDPNTGDPNYCSASGGCVEHISRVQVGSIDNSSACDPNGYADFSSIATEMEVGKIRDRHLFPPEQAK